MEPIAETRDTIRRMGAQGEMEITDDATRVNDLLTARIPDVVAFSLRVTRQDVTLTYVSSRDETARLDAFAHAEDGPPDQAVRSDDDVTAHHGDLLDEGRWQLVAQAGAATGIRSTLSLPVLEDGRVVASVSLYGRTSTTFVGRHHEMATLVGGWAPGAVTNADLGFATRLDARRSPQRLEDLETVRVAVNRLVEERGVSAELVESKLYAAAARAGIPVVVLAHMVIGEADDQSGGPC